MKLIVTEPCPPPGPISDGKELKKSAGIWRCEGCRNHLQGADSRLRSTRKSNPGGRGGGHVQPRLDLAPPPQPQQNMSQTRYFSTRGGAETLSFDEVSAASCAPLLVLVLLCSIFGAAHRAPHRLPSAKPVARSNSLAGCPHRPGAQRRPVHPDRDPHPPSGLGDGVGQALVRRALARHPEPLHPRRLDPLRRPEGHHRPLVRDLPLGRRHAPPQDGGRRVHPRAVAWPHLGVQGRCAPVCRQRVRVPP